MAKDKLNKKAKTVISIDNYTQSSYELKGKTLFSKQKPTWKSNSVSITYLANKDMIIAPIEIGAGITSDDLEGALENRAYEELGLDPTVEYIINHKEIFHEGDGRLYQLFIIEKDRYRDIFEPLQKEIKYIDIITPAPLLYEALYDLALVEPKGIHTYLYFTKHDTFVTFYKDGKYFYSKSLKYSFEQIYNRFWEIVGENVDEKMFFNILQKEGMKTTKEGYQQNIMKLFGEIFISVNDIIIYTKRAYNLEIIDQMFIGSSMGPIVGLDDYAQNYLGLSSSPLEFDFDLQSDANHVDQLQYMMTVTAFKYLSHPEVVTNFTLYPRPPAFFKRSSGQFISTTLLVTALGVSLPAYYYVTSKANETYNSILQKQELKLGQEVEKYKTILSQKKKKITKLDKEIDSLRKTFSGKEKTLIAVHDKKVSYRLKSEQIKSFSEDLAKYGVKTYNIQTDKNEYSLSLVSPNDKDITKLITAVSEKYKNDITSIDIKRIQKDNNSTFYRGILKVVLR